MLLYLTLQQPQNLPQPLPRPRMPLAHSPQMSRQQSPQQIPQTRTRQPQTVMLLLPAQTRALLPHQVLLSLAVPQMPRPLASRRPTAAGAARVQPLRSPQNQRHMVTQPAMVVLP